MRPIKDLIADLVRKPPMLFPFVGLFHILGLMLTLWSMRHEPLDTAWLSVLWMMAYTISWLAVCDLRRWGAWCYLGLTLLDFMLYFLLHSPNDKRVYVSSIFLIDGLFSFFILVYYKRFG
jgi:hypothetical protein